MTAIDRSPLAQPPWHCAPQVVTCHAGHVFVHGKAGFYADMRDMLGHMFLICQNCQPPSYYFALFMREPSPLVLCYALSKDSYYYWQERSGRTPPTAELLYHLRDPNGRSHFPDWKPSR